MTPRRKFGIELRKALVHTLCKLEICCNDERGNVNGMAYQASIDTIPGSNIAAWESKFFDWAPKLTIEKRWIRFCGVTVRVISRHRHVGNLMWDMWVVPTEDALRLLAAKRFLKYYTLTTGDTAVFDAWCDMADKHPIDPAFL